MWRQFKDSIVGGYINTINNISPLKKESNINEGILTPDEFIMGGNALISKNNNWNWCSKDKNSAVDYLPEDKQYLICKELKSNNYNDIYLDKLDDDNDNDNNNDNWNTIKKIMDDLPEFKYSQNEIDDEIDPTVVTIDIKNNNESDENRFYNIIITYDKYYQTPHVWLYGNSIDGTPLSIEVMSKDISSEHINKTATFVNTQFNTLCISIHPCNHSTIMKKIITQLLDNGRTFTIDDYFVLFLKFITTIIPNILIT